MFRKNSSGFLSASLYLHVQSSKIERERKGEGKGETGKRRGKGRWTGRGILDQGNVTGKRLERVCPNQLHLCSQQSKLSSLASLSLGVWQPPLLLGVWHPPLLLGKWQPQQWGGVSQYIFHIVILKQKKRRTEELRDDKREIVI